MLHVFSILFTENKCNEEEAKSDFFDSKGIPNLIHPYPNLSPFDSPYTDRFVTCLCTMFTSLKYTCITFCGLHAFWSFAMYTTVTITQEKMKTLPVS